MTKNKKILLNITKLTSLLVVFLFLSLFIYAAFIYDKTKIENKIEKEEINNKKLKEEKIKTQKKKIEEKTIVKKKNYEVKTPLKDGIFVTVGDKAITRFDVLNEVKSFLILNQITFTEDQREELQKSAINSIIKRTVKEIEISKQQSLRFNKDDFNKELNKLAEPMNLNLDDLKEIFKSNNTDFLIVENKIKTDLLWNSLIFSLYSNRVSVNFEEIEEQLRSSHNKKVFYEFLLSDIIINKVDVNKLETVIKELKNKIEIYGFEAVAREYSMSHSAANGGDLGWIDENEIPKQYRSVVLNTPTGLLSEPIFLPEGIVFFKIREKRETKNIKTLEELKNEFVNAEKTKILRMYSRSHFDKLRRSIPVKYFQ